MAFSYDPTTSRGRVRLRISDTKAEAPAFSDAEIDALISDEGGWSGAVVAAARILLTDRARFARIYSNPEGSVDETAGLSALESVIAQYSAKTTDSLPTVLVRNLGSHPMDPNDTR
jgi:hypothetical protein